MKILLVYAFLLILLASCTQRIYIVRHAEKATANAGEAMMTNDPPLTEAGRQRALVLKEKLGRRNIAYIFSTNTLRTRSTAEPLRSQLGLKIETYAPVPDSAFVQHLFVLKKNILLVGHSNTVDDLVRLISGHEYIPGDLPDNVYDNLYLLKRRGRRVRFSQQKFGARSH